MTAIGNVSNSSFDNRNNSLVAVGPRPGAAALQKQRAVTVTVKTWIQKIVPSYKPTILTTPIPPYSSLPSMNRGTNLPGLPGEVGTFYSRPPNYTFGVTNQPSSPGAVLAGLLSNQVVISSPNIPNYPNQLDFTAPQSKVIVSAFPTETLATISSFSDRRKVLAASLILSALGELRRGEIRPADFKLVISTIVTEVGRIPLEPAVAPTSRATTSAPTATQLPSNTNVTAIARTKAPIATPLVPKPPGVLVPDVDRGKVYGNVAIGSGSIGESISASLIAGTGKDLIPGIMTISRTPDSPVYRMRGIAGTNQVTARTNMWGANPTTIILTASVPLAKNPTTGEVDRAGMFKGNLNIVGPLIGQIGSMPKGVARTIMAVTNPTHGIAQYADLLLNNPNIRVVGHAGTDQLRAEFMSGPVGGAPVIIGDHSTMMLPLRSDGKILPLLPNYGPTVARQLGKSPVYQTVNGTLTELDRLYAGVPANYATPLSGDDANWLGSKLGLALPTGLVITAPRTKTGVLDRALISRVLADPTIHTVSFNITPISATNQTDRTAELNSRKMSFTNLERARESAQFVVNQRQTLISELMPERRTQLTSELQNEITNWQKDYFPSKNGNGKEAARLRMRNLVAELTLLDNALLRLDGTAKQNPTLRALLKRGNEINAKF
jgi:hypothetical protein